MDQKLLNKQLKLIKKKATKGKVSNEDLVTLINVLKDRIEVQGDARSSIVASNKELSIRRINPVLKLAANIGSAFSRDVNARANIIYPIYSPTRLEQAVHKETILKRRQRIYLEKIFNNGYIVFSKNDNVTKYIKKRLHDMYVITGKLFDEILSDIALSLVNYEYAGFILHQSIAGSRGKPWAFMGKVREPIAWIETIDPVISRFVSKENGVIEKMFIYPYLREQDDMNHDTGDTLAEAMGYVFGGFNTMFSIKKSQTINKDRLVMITLPKPQGLIYPIPEIYPLIDDIQLLRDLEEIAKLISIQYGIALLHARVGTDDEPSLNPNEDSEVARKIEEMAMNGFTVTDYRVDIKPIDLTKVNQIDKYLEYFKKRVISGAGISEVSLGLGSTANRGTAIIVDKIVVSGAKFIQMYISLLTKKLFDIFLYEAGMNPFNLKEDDRAWIQFNEVDTDLLIALEEHYNNLWLNNAYTYEEFRHKLGEYDNPNLNRTYAKLFKEDKSEQSGNKSSNIVLPANQYGKKKTKGTSANDN